MNTNILIAALAIATTAIAAPRDDRSAEALGWRLGVQAWSFNHFTFFEAVDKAHALGLKYIEIFPGQSIGGDLPNASTDFTMDKPTREAIKKKLAGAGISPTCYGVVTPGSEAEWRALFSFAKDMGIGTIVSEPAPDQLPMLDKLCAEFGINLALHNHPKPSRYWAPETVLNAVSGCSARVGSCADTGHWRRSGRDPRECLALLGPRVVSFHFKDLNALAAPQHDVPWGTGVNNAWGMLADLKTRGFHGPFSIEYENNWESSMPEIARCIEYFDLAATALDDADYKPLFQPGLANATMQPGGWSLDSRMLVPNGKDNIWTRESYGDFILDLEFRTTTNSNSGVFIRTGDTVNWLHTTIEVQILQPTMPNPRQNCAAIYDVQPPAKDALKPIGEWNRMVIMARGSRIFVVLNGEQVTAADLDQWTEAHKNPDGTPNKFNTAYKDMPRKGPIGLQYHGSQVWFRNLRVKELRSGTRE